MKGFECTSEGEGTGKSFNLFGVIHKVRIIIASTKSVDLRITCENACKV